MAAGDNIAITNTKVAALNADQTLTFMAADADTADLAQKFVYTPTGKDSKILFGVQVATGHGAVATSFANGVGVFAKGAKTGSVAAAATEVIEIETGRFLLANGTIELTLTPASGKRLTTDHVAKVWVVELI